MNVHFIAIGGSAMHNLAISLHKKGYRVSGSDDEIFEPSKSRLEKYGILPSKIGWDENSITSDLDAVILGMHAREDNPELIKAKELNLKIYSYPEYLYEQTKDKTRVVIGGSHGKTTITSMVMHVLNYCKIKFDYMVGAQLEGFETMVSLTEEAKVAVFEGDEYLSSPIDRRPKFHLYNPDIAVLSGIAWDHINVFPTFENYKEQFSIFIDKITKGGSLFYFGGDSVLNEVVTKTNSDINKVKYEKHPYKIDDNKTYLLNNGQAIGINVFGDHNLQNISAAKMVCTSLGIREDDFYKAISDFKGAAKRLEILEENDDTIIFRDFAHSPSKLKATVSAVKQQYTERKLIAVMELHTFSSLRQDFLKEYHNTMIDADEAIVYFNPEVIVHKKLEPISEKMVFDCFGKENLQVFTKKTELIEFLKEKSSGLSCLLLMSSGNFSGIDLKKFAKDLLKN